MLTLPVQPRSWHRSNYALYMLVALASIILSAYIAGRETVINPDAVCYLLSAQAITEQGVKASMQVCPQASWPFYSFLVATLSKWMHVSYQFAAYVCDGLCTLISAVTFLAIINTLGATKRILWLAAAVILLSHEFNYVRQYIVRDHGFWAFYLVSLLCLLRFVSSTILNKKVLYALAWGMSLGVATLFRIEGAIFILALPFAIFFLTDRSWVERFKAYFLLHLLTLTVGVGVVAWLLVHPEATVNKLGRVPEVAYQLQSGWQMMLTRYKAMHVAMVQHVLPFEAARDASGVLVLTIIFLYLLNVVGNLSWVYSGLVIYAWWNRVAKFTPPATLVVVAYTVVNFVITLSFFAERIFLAKRYLIAFSLTLMIWVPYALNHLIEHRAQIRHRIGLYIVVILIAIAAVAGIFDFGYSKTYIRQAGTWLAKNVPSQANLYMNDLQLMYYSERDRNNMYQVLSRPLGNIKQYDYVALRVKHNEKKPELSFPAVAEFANKRGDKVIIYKIAKN